MSLDFGSSNTRRLPVYFVICTGDTMIGKPIQTVMDGLRALHQDLLSQPQAVEQVWISLITYATDARQLIPLETLSKFFVPELTPGGATNLGEGLQTLVRSLQKEIIPSSTEMKADYRPLVFLLLDGDPTDRWEQQIAALEKARDDKLLGTFIAVGIGAGANLGVLRQLTDSVLWMKELNQETLYSFFRWTNASVTTVSQSIALLSDYKTTPLPKPPDGSEIIL